MVINADCHSANRGIFLGFMLLLSSIVVMVIFYTSLPDKRKSHLGMTVYLVQDCVLVLLAFVACLVAYTRMAILDVNRHPITFLDDFLLCIPLPFYFIRAILVVMAELQGGGSLACIVIEVSRKRCNY